MNVMRYEWKGEGVRDNVNKVINAFMEYLEWTLPEGSKARRGRNTNKRK